MARVLAVTTPDGESHRFGFSRWETAGELVIYAENGELAAVFADGAWCSAVVVEGGEK